MSLLLEYKNRTQWKYDQIPGIFSTDEGLTRKVYPDGSFAPFFGSTVVFKADENCVKAITEMQVKLYQELEANGILADELPASTIHMTLHDLISPEMCTSDPNESAEAYNLEVEDSIKKAGKVLESLREKYAIKEIHMVADRIVSMVRKSLVLLLQPETEEDFEQLMILYNAFNCIKKLPYELTPHITLAYYRPSGPDESKGEALRKAVDLIQIDPLTAPKFTFSTEEITVQRFENMAEYMDA